MGFKSLQEVAELSGIPRRTLHNWATDKPKALRTVLLGAWLLKHGESIKGMI